MNKIFLVGIISIIVLSCSGSQEQPVEVFDVSQEEDQITLTDEQMKNVGIQTVSLKDRELAFTINATGFIDVPPNAMAGVSAPSGGYVRTSKFLVGNYVKKGDVLVVLEDPNIVQLQQDYLLAKSNLSYAQKDYIRQKDLNENKASSDKAMQMAHTDAQNQKIMMNAIADRLRILGVNPERLHSGNIQKSIAVKAPISGYISAVNISLGQYVSPADRLFDIINTNEKQLVLKVFEKDLSKIRVGQKVYAFSNENPENQLVANVFLIGKNFEVDRSVLVYCNFGGSIEHLAKGTFLNAKIETENKISTSISDDAVVTWEGKQYVFEELKPKTYKMVEVQIGNSENGYTELVNTSQNFMNKKFVTKGAYQLLMGLKNIEE